MTPLENSFRFDRCPLCATARIEELGRIEYQEPISFSTQVIALRFQPELWRCRDCGSGFVQNVLPPAVAAELYSVGDSGDRWRRPPFREQHTRKVLWRLDGLLRPPLTVLDVGAGNGGLLDYARARGCRTAAVEYSASSLTALSTKGHVAFSALEKAGSGYDLVTAFDLIEHLYDVPGFLANCRAAVKPQGLVAMLTGDIQSATARLARARWWYCRYPEHIVFPSRNYLARRTSFELTGCVRTFASRTYDVGLIARLQGLIKGMVTKSYSGLPALGPDHLLIFLRRR